MTPELIATAGFVLLALAVATYLLHRQCKLTNKALDVIDVYKHALDDERKAHRSTHARLIEEQRLHKDTYL